MDLERTPAPSRPPALPAPPVQSKLRRELQLAPSCDDVRAVIVSELRDPADSMATLRVRNRNGFQTCRTGDKLNGRRVLFIGTQPFGHEPRVWLERSGALCHASLYLDSREKQQRAESSLAAGHDLRAMLGPVRKDSLIARLGIENGDVLESIDGRNMSPAHLLELYGRIVTHKAHRITVGLRRRGTPITIQYRID
jgi:hypothetical protein